MRHSLKRTARATVPDLMLHASLCYRQRGTGPVPNWADYCYLPVNAEVGYCQHHGMGPMNASFIGRHLSTAQAFLAAQLIIRMDPVNCMRHGISPLPAPFRSMS